MDINMFLYIFLTDMIRFINNTNVMFLWYNHYYKIARVLQTRGKLPKGDRPIFMNIRDQVDRNNEHPQ